MSRFFINSLLWLLLSCVCLGQTPILLTGVGSTKSAASSPIVLDGSVHCAADNGNTAATTVSCTLTNVTAGDLITCSGEMNSASSTIFVSLADATNGTYSTPFVKLDSNNAVWNYSGYFMNAASGTYVVTATQSSSQQFMTISCEAWKNVKTSGVLDMTAILQSQGLASTANPTSGSTQTPAQNNELIYGSMDGACTSVSAGTNYTLIDTNPTDCTWPEYWIQTTKTATNTPYTAASASWLDIQAAYLPASASATSTIALDYVGNSAAATTGTTISWSHTVGSAPHQVLVVETGTDQNASNCKFNGVDMGTAIYSHKDGAAVLWGNTFVLAGPAVGQHTITCTFAATLSIGYGISSSWSGVNQSTPNRTAVTSVDNGSGSTSASNTVSNAQSGDMIVDVFESDTVSSITATSNLAYTVFFITHPISEAVSLGMAAQAATGSTTSTWTFGSTVFWTHVSFALIPG